MTSRPAALTPVEKRDGVWFKRDDTFVVANVRGGKARACLVLSRAASTGLVTACARHSPQADIVASIATSLGLPSWIHAPSGSLTDELSLAARHGAKLKRHRAGYNSVIIARAREDAEKRNATLIPFGMESPEAVAWTARQVANLPAGIRRVVVPVGSGLTLAGILTGLLKRRRAIPVVGVVIGADPCQRLERWAPPGWKSMATLRRTLLPYDRTGPVVELSGVPLDPIYESKCVPFLRPGDCFWIVGHRNVMATD